MPREALWRRDEKPSRLPAPSRWTCHPSRRRAAEPLSTGSEWSFDLIARYDREIARVAAQYGLDTYPNQVEIISAEQMMDAYASNGMPIGYHHWSFGKRFLATEQVYKRAFIPG